MNENTIFQGVGPLSNSPISQSLSTPSQPVQPVAPQPIVQNLTPQPLGVVQAPVATGGVPPPTIPTNASPLPGSFFSKLSMSGIIKAVVGIIVVLLIAFIVFGVVIPLFFSNKNENVSLMYWGLWEDPRVMQSVINDFQKEHPTITIKYEKQDVRQYRQRLQTRIQNGNGPDLFRFHNTWLPEIGDSIAPLPNDVISPDQFKKIYYPVMQSDLTQNGAIYGIPLQIDTLALFTNIDILDAASINPPTNWEDFGKNSRTLTVKDENGKIITAGAALGAFDNITHAPDIISLLFMQNGANIYDLTTTSQASTDTLSYYTQYASGDDNVWDTTLDPSLLAFTKGNLAMYFGYSWDIFTIQSGNPQLHFEISPVPHLPLGRKTTIASYWIEGVSQKSKHQKEAMLFMKYMTKKETLQKMFSEASKTRQFGELYPRSDMANDLKDNKLIYPFVSQAPNAVSSFFESDTYDEGLDEKANIYLGNAVRSILDNTSVESALETLTAGVSQVLQKYGQQ